MPQCFSKRFCKYIYVNILPPIEYWNVHSPCQHVRLIFTIWGCEILLLRFNSLCTPFIASWGCVYFYMCVCGSDLLSWAIRTLLTFLLCCVLITALYSHFYGVFCCAEVFKCNLVKCINSLLYRLSFLCLLFKKLLILRSLDGLNYFLNVLKFCVWLSDLCSTCNFLLLFIVR